MKLEHIAIWTHQLEKLKDFYVQYFRANSNDKYLSEKEFKGCFESYFLSFDTGARLELMKLPSIPQGDNANGFEATGLTHIAFSVKTPDELDRLYVRLKETGNLIVGEPHMTGDGYYEACVLDPDGNRVEITVTPDDFRHTIKSKEEFYQKVLKEKEIVTDPKNLKCVCHNTMCHLHGKCKECIALHRYENEHIPVCLKPVFHDTLQSLLGILDITATKKEDTPIEYYRYVKEKNQQGQITE